MSRSITLIRLPLPLKRALREFAKREGTSVDAICARALTEHIDAFAPDLLLEDGQGENCTGLIIRFTNHILCEAIDANVNLVTIENEGVDFGIYALTTNEKRELGRWPLPWMNHVRARLLGMARGGSEFTVTHNGHGSRISLASLEPTIIRLEIANKPRS